MKILLRLKSNSKLYTLNNNNENTDLNKKIKLSRK